MNSKSTTKSSNISSLFSRFLSILTNKNTCCPSFNSLEDLLTLEFFPDVFYVCNGRVYGVAPEDDETSDDDVYYTANNTLEKEDEDGEDAPPPSSSGTTRRSRTDE